MTPRSGEETHGEVVIYRQPHTRQLGSLYTAVFESSRLALSVMLTSSRILQRRLGSATGERASLSMSESEAI